MLFTSWKQIQVLIRLLDLKYFTIYENKFELINFLKRLIYL